MSISGSRMSKKQDFLTRIRYQNPLPPPPFPPKLLDIPIDTTRFTHVSFLDDLVREEGVNVDLDCELGLPLSLVEIDGLFEGDESGMYAPPSGAPITPLDPKDEELLSFVLPDLNAASVKPKQKTNVSFLRRALYESNPKASSLKPGTTKSKGRKDGAASAPVIPVEDFSLYLNTQYQHEKILETFAECKKEIHTHPRKKQRTVKRTWAFLPDIEDTLGPSMLTVKFANDPHDKASDATFEKEDYALIKPLIDSRQENYLAYYVLQKGLDKFVEDLGLPPDDERREEHQRHAFTHTKDFAAASDPDRPVNAYAILFKKSDKKDELKAYYTKIQSKLTLQNRRQTKKGKQRLEDMNLLGDIFDVEFRKPTAKEERARQLQRNEIDPEKYPAPDPLEEDEEEVVESDGNAEANGDEENLNGEDDQEDDDEGKEQSSEKKKEQVEATDEEVSELSDMDE